ncbi:MAG TPA: valine--tRNA ligase [Bacteroidia bacterium]|nr:valine--tRNA ligase [Bacteroidia bacterium]HNU32887.1 valine--tRNA ligase [Bacteroidia bacterium]
MSEISKTYSPKETESKWYKYWMENNFFRSVPDEREPYTIVIPPPNVTGVLHMGHMLNNTLQDVLIRRARMLGKNACWVPGTDHASIATEAKVVQMLREKGIKKSDLTRDEFLKYAWEWKEKYGGIILDQLKKLGASCDWERTRFTMDENYYEDVINVFIDLYNKGYIYRGLRMVNWDPVAKTAVSDEEVYFKQLSSKLVYVKYKIVDGDGYLTVATVRPETIMGDVAVAVHPDDERYKHLAGKKVIVPLVNHEVPIIFDDAIDKEFGTGCLKVTPAHDIVDYEIGLRHSLPVIDTINEDGTISEAGVVFVGMDRFAARKAAIKKLEDDGLIEKSEDYSHQVGHSERTNAVIEPRLSQQWFLKMKDISKPALDAVMNGEVNLIPDKFKNTYRHWMENVKDWCLSRQLWWGHRIPAWYDESGNYVVAKTKEEALKLFQQKTPNTKPETIKQDEDVLDTWASSWLWPISVFDGYAKPDGEIKYYYPTNDLITAPEILFFWVARMIIAGYEYKNEKPFQNVYLTGIVRDKLGRKMSKSLGNSPEPLELIEKFGADGVRMGMLLCSPAGNDLPFDESYCEQGRNFSNKIWNAFRLIKGWRVDENSKQSEECKTATEWFANRFNEQLELINDSYNKYRISEALMITYKLFWDDYCAWYLEMIKPAYTEGLPPVIDKTTYDATIGFFESLLKTLHPFMPFITEELWHQIREREEKDCIITAKWPGLISYDKTMLSSFEQSRNVITSIRSLRQEKNISPKIALELKVKATATLSAQSIIHKLANIISTEQVTTSAEKSFSLRVDGYELFVPIPGNLDTSAEKERLQKELDYNKGFLESVMKKLSNQNFVSKAKPEVIASEEKKKADAQQKIKAIEEQLLGL